MQNVGVIRNLDSQDGIEKLICNYIESDETRAILTGTLKKLEASNYLIEDEYVDKDYLVDYTSFFSRCHKQYNRFCRRIHFFSSEFELTNDAFSDYVNHATAGFVENLNASYLGFVVLKEFKGKWLMGRTCLKHYPQNNDRYYLAVRDYQVNLYGISLVVHSMAFQEQDEATGVCASVALYSALNVTGVKYQHHIPSLSEVTKLCLSESSYGNSTGGLSTSQIAVGIAKIGLHPDIYEPANDREIRAVIYAYLKFGVPIVCGLWLFDEGADGQIDYGSLTYHAVTINGFSLEGGKPEESYKNELNLYACRMTRLFVHDDQLGPFVKMNFTYNWQTIMNKGRFKKITTAWKSNNSNSPTGFKVARVQSLIIPLQLKARVSFRDVEKEVKAFNIEFKEKLLELSIAKSPIIEWDIYLTSVNDLKKDLLGRTPIDKEKILKSSFAKYLWRAIATVNNNPVFELVFDGTDSVKSGIPRSEIFYSEEYKEFYNWYINQKK